MPEPAASRRYPRPVPVIRPVILSGGSGTRLWPVSTDDLPKQFAPLLGSRSLFERTIERLQPLDVFPPVVVTGSNHVGLVQNALGRAGLDGGLVIVEPEGRNTAPAALAAALAVGGDEVLVILPSDHLIADEAGFRSAILSAARLAGSGRIVTFGIVPSSPETGYGYIETGEPVDGAFEVTRFKEKPGMEEASRMVADGRHLWNSGIFVVRAGTLLDEGRLHCTDLVEGVSSTMGDPGGGLLELGPGFSEVEKISLDNAIMEKTSTAAVIPIDVGWDDLGSFEALWSVSPKDENDNIFSGDVVAIDVTGSLVLASTRRVAVAGLSDVVVVETPEGVLVVPRSRSQVVKQLIEDVGTVTD